MTKIQAVLVFICSAAALCGFGLWFYVAPDYEPAIGVIISIGTMVTSYWPFASREPRVTAEQKIAARDEWRQLFEKFFREKAQRDVRTDTIIHDVARMDIYPEISEGKGISPWFRAGLMGTYHRGVLLGRRWAYIVQQPDGSWTENSKGDEGTKVILVGAVPYESIESVNWDGDSYYNKPHIFCHFDHNGQPYERMYYATQNRIEHPTIKHHYFYTEIAKYEPKRPWWKLF